MRSWLKRVGMEEGMALESKMVSRWIENAQKKVEEYNFEIRKSLLEYDEVMDEQRKTVYSWRQKILERRDIEEEIMALAEDALIDGLNMYINPKAPPEEWDIRGLADWFDRKYGELPRIPPEKQAPVEVLEDFLIGRIGEIYASKCEEAGKEPLMRWTF
jgi:preprotein translocase subunit SecA